jgi:hypothetical protein
VLEFVPPPNPSFHWAPAAATNAPAAPVNSWNVVDIHDDVQVRPVITMSTSVPNGGCLYRSTWKCDSLAFFSFYMKTNGDLARRQEAAMQKVAENL